MELKNLHYFLETARAGSLTKAAKALHVTQPTLSRQIAQLEYEVGASLFIRKSHSIELTDKGRLLSLRAQEILEMTRRMEAELQQLNSEITGDIHIGCAEAGSFSQIASLLAKVKKEHSGIRIHLYSGDTSDLTDRMERGLLDFILLAQNPDLSIYNAVLLHGTERWGVVMKQSDPLAAKQVVHLDDLKNRPLIVPRQGLQEDLPRLFQEKTEDLNVAATINLIYNAAALVEQDIGLLISFESMAPQGNPEKLCFLPFDPPLETKMYFAWKKHPSFGRAAQCLLEKLKAEFGNTGISQIDD